MLVAQTSPRGLVRKTRPQRGDKRHGRARVTNRPSKFDGRSELGRRVRDLANGFAEQLGGWPALSDTLAANVRKAAELTALAEKARADALRDGNATPTILLMVRLEGAANRAVRALQLERRRPSEPGLRPAPLSGSAS
jgi:hypothetical protein